MRQDPHRLRKVADLLPRASWADSDEAATGAPVVRHHLLIKPQRGDPSSLLQLSTEKPLRATVQVDEDQVHHPIIIPGIGDPIGALIVVGPEIYRPIDLPQNLLIKLAVTTFPIHVRRMVGGIALGQTRPVQVCAPKDIAA